MRTPPILLACATAFALTPLVRAGDPAPFTGSFRMETHLFKGAVEQKHSPVNLKVWSLPERVLYETVMPNQTHQMRMMADLRGNFIYTLMDNGQGGRTAMKMPRPDARIKAQEEKGAKAGITVTKETKVIDGHTCTKVIATSTEGVWTGWVATDLPNAFVGLAKSMSGATTQQNQHARADVQGFPLEFEWVAAKGDERTVGYIKDLVVGKVDDALFDLSGYQVMEMPAFNIPQR